MFDIHRGIGEGLFLIYAIVIAVVLILNHRGRTTPPWLIGIAHGLLGLQVALGVILISDSKYDAPWYHPVLGLAALLSLGLTPVLKRRLSGVYGVVATLSIVGVLTLAARLAVL